MERVIVVGGGHNALVAAAYLARAGRQVVVLERGERVGGAAVGVEAFDGTGAQVSRYAYLVSLFPERIARDLGVDLRLRERAVAAYAGGLVVERTPDLLPSASRLHATLTEPLPTAAEARALLGEQAWRDLVERPLGEVLRERLADPVMRGMVGTDGLIGTFASLDDPSLLQNRCFLYHVMGGPWRVPVGGMGEVTGALRDAAVRAGAELRCGCEVVAIDPRTREVTWDEEGKQRTVGADWVLAGVAPAVLAGLVGEGAVPPTSGGCQMKVNMLLDRLPALRSGIEPAVAFAGTFRLWESVSELEAAFVAAARGEVPERPPAELYCHTLVDPSVAPGGRHVLTLFGLHAPASLFREREDDVRGALVERYLDGLDEQLAEPIRECIARDADGRPCVEAHTPLDLERDLGMPGGNIFHGGLEWPWREDGSGDRWGVATAHERVLLCGAGARRGGGVSGIGGHNAAMAVLDR